MNILFENIRVINPAQNLDYRVNLWIKDGIINLSNADGASLDADIQIINGKELCCCPGLFDMHVHLREPGYEYKEDLLSGAAAAANGGFTGVACMPNTNPAIDNAQVVEYIKQKTKDSLVDVSVAAALTVNREGKHITPMLELDEIGVVMFTDDGSSVENSEVMRKVFDYAASRDLLISQHCENHTLTKDFAMNEGALSDKLGLKGYPYVAEEIIIARDIMLSEYCGKRRYHVSHVSTNGGVRIIKEAKSRGLRVSCEVTPHHFTFIDKSLKNYDTNFKMNPPLRRKRDMDAIFEGLIDGTIDCIASDHAPHALHEKEVEFEKAPLGIVGLETSLGVSLTNLVHAGYLSFNQLIEKMSVNPRKILGLPEIIIKDGEKANLTIFAPNEEWIVNKSLFKSKSHNTPFNGMRLKGRQKYTINNGQFIECEI